MSDFHDMLPWNDDFSVNTVSVMTGWTPATPDTQNIPLLDALHTLKGGTPSRATHDQTLWDAVFDLFFRTLENRKRASKGLVVPRR